MFFSDCLVKSDEAETSLPNTKHAYLTPVDLWQYEMFSLPRLPEAQDPFPAFKIFVVCLSPVKAKGYVTHFNYFTEVLLPSK